MAYSQQQEKPQFRLRLFSLFTNLQGDKIDAVFDVLIAYLVDIILNKITIILAYIKKKQ